MRIFRTVMWTLLVAAIGLFVMVNWGERHDVVFWPGADNSRLVFEWPIGFIALFFFLLGLVPTVVYYRGVVWRRNRRIGHLEQVTRNALAPRSEPPAAATQPGTPSPQETNSRSEPE